jgi:hypothetical protein
MHHLPGDGGPSQESEGVSAHEVPGENKIHRQKPQKVEQREDQMNRSFVKDVRRPSQKQSPGHDLRQDKTREKQRKDESQKHKPNPFGQNAEKRHRGAF